MTAINELSTTRWQRFRAAYLATLTHNHCHICGGPVDLTLPGTHRDGPTVDHLTPRSRGGRVYDPGNVALAHQHCNARRRNDELAPRHSRRW
jgi:5-methylcytosine-specific restriction endonuclease McrA